MMTSEEYQYLLTVDAIRQRAEQIFQRTLENKAHFSLQLEKLNDIADLVVNITRHNYPSGKIPLHSRWRHFVIDGQDRSNFLDKLPSLDRAKAQLDLAMISVLLDAGAGPEWSYRDNGGRTYTRSEGLAVASLDMFAAGSFSADKNSPWQVDGEALQRLSLEKLADGMQVNHRNPLLGLEGRWHLLQSLGRLLTENAIVFPGARPAGLYDYLIAHFGATLTASHLVNVLLLHLNSIWPGRTSGGYALGDIWEYPSLGWVPFHKLTLWLTLSVIEPLQAAKLAILEIEQLPGLAEYRNGGLFIDGGVLIVKDRELLVKDHLPAEPLIIEWRALTIALLEKLAPLVRKKLGMDSRELPLVSILQGGTWQAGRQLALQRSPAGQPPLRYTSTGTVF